VVSLLASLYSPVRNRLAIAALALALLAPASARAQEAPVIRIRARARLEVGAVERSAGGVAVAGALWDDAAAAGVPGKRVRVTLRGAETFEGETLTGAGGSA
jgi:hypothetical protein